MGIYLTFGPFLSVKPVQTCMNSRCQGNRPARGYAIHRHDDTACWFCAACLDKAKMELDPATWHFPPQLADDPFALFSADAVSAGQAEVDGILHSLTTIKGGSGFVLTPPSLTGNIPDGVPRCVAKEARKLVDAAYGRWLEDKTVEQFTVRDVCLTYLELPIWRRMEELAELTGYSKAQCLREWLSRELAQIADRWGYDVSALLTDRELDDALPLGRAVGGLADAGRAVAAGVV